MRATLNPDLLDQPRPEWAGKTHLDERKFFNDFCVRYPMIYAEGVFFSTAGMEPEERVKKFIYDYISYYYSSDLHRIVYGLTEGLKLECRQEYFHPPLSVIHVANGTYTLGEEFSTRKQPCRNRLPVDYNPKAPEPKLWLKFLGDLLEPEDIPTLQEFIGYCLIPTNVAQKMLILVGRGGEGKSRIGVILSQLLGDCMCNGSLNKLEKSPFARADLQNRLLMVDDDLQLTALTTTGNIKSIVTAEQRLDLERKGIQSYQGQLYCRLMAFGNGSPRAVHDRSYGFFRRQILLQVRPRPKDRVDDPYLAYRMRDELEGILLWALEGLERLLMNNMAFTISPRATRNLLQAHREENNVLEFMSSTGYIRFDPKGHITCRQLYAVYCEWCEDNSLTACSAMDFSSTLISEAASYGLTYSTHIPGGSGREVRGFRGLRSIVM